MRTATVIIGSGFGDEGKGLATDYHAAPSGPDALVVRFNGGAQAGHTVVTPDGRRHVFSHIGSGSFTGARTYLSRWFVCHPMLYFDELGRLRDLGVVPDVSVDRDCPVTTPFDVMINQAVEAARGGQRHGSCGVGFGETLERQQFAPFRLTAGELGHPATLRRRLHDIRDRYLPRRLAALGLGALPDVLRADEIVERYIEDCAAFRDHVRITDERILQTLGPVIFEGAQGLLLDMHRGVFPHVTRSNTGLENVVALAREAGITRLDVTYVSRWYATRHGAGPLAHERPVPPLVDFQDATNRPNAWQGSLRFGVLAADALIDAVQHDLGDAKTLRVRHEWLITWADRAPDAIELAAGSIVRRARIGELASRLVTATGAERCRLAFGQNRLGVDQVRLNVGRTSPGVRRPRSVTCRDAPTQPAPRQAIG